MDKITIIPSKLSGKVVAPPSKSYAHRILISAFIRGEKTTIKNIGSSKDVLATISALTSMGAKFEMGDNSVTLLGVSIPTQKVIVDCNESGSTLRFLLPVAAALGINAKFTGKGRLLERPIEDLVLALNEHGANIKDLEVLGKLQGGNYKINAGVSSQYITGLMFALAILSDNSTLELVGNLVSEPYVDITIDVLKSFGFNIVFADNSYKSIKTKFKVKDSYYVEGDWSSASFMLSMAAIGGDITVEGLNVNSYQGDKEIAKILEKFGANVDVLDNAIRVKKGDLKGISYNIENTPDLAQIVAVVASYSQGQTILTGVSRLKLKESDRILAIIKSLKTAGIYSEYKNDSIIITGGTPTAGEQEPTNDHRSVMSAIALSTFASGSSTVTKINAIDKSYPEFIEHYKQVGGKFNG